MISAIKPDSRRLAILVVVLLTAAAALPAAGQSHSRSDLAQGEPPQEGRGEFELVLIHGLGANAKVWDEVLPFLQNTFKVRTFELSGHGTTQPIANPTITAEVSRLAEFIAAEGFVYPTIVGHGIGGMIALQYALDHPADIYRLIVMDSAPMQLAGAEQKAAVAEQLVSDYDRFVASRYLNLSKDPDLTDRILDMALRTDSTSLASLLMSSFDYDMTSRLEGLSVPMLIIGSEAMFPAADSPRQLLEVYGFHRARSLSFKRLAGAGHYMMLEQPVMTASILLAFGVKPGYEFEN